MSSSPASQLTVWVDWLYIVEKNIYKRVHSSFKFEVANVLEQSQDNVVNKYRFSSQILFLTNPVI